MKLSEIIEPKVSINVVDPDNVFDDVAHRYYNEILHSCNYLNRQLLYRWVENNLNIFLDCDDIDVSANLNDLDVFYELLKQLIIKHMEKAGGKSINVGRAMLMNTQQEIENIRNWKPPKITYNE